MSKIHLSVDIWTSSAGTNYVAVVAPWLDEKKLRQALLGLPLLKGPHSGENVASVISSVVDYYDISTLLGYFMIDNAKNNRTTVAELAKRYPTVKASSQLRCCGHILNLIVKALLFGKGVSNLERKLCGASDEDKFDTWRKHSFIGKLHNFCVRINRTDQRRELLKKYIVEACKAKDIEVLYQRVLVDGGIRWNSVYRMIERALKLRDAIDLFFLNYEYDDEDIDISQDKLEKQDWIDLSISMTF